MKVRMNFTLDADTAERLRQLAFEQHKTMSQALTELIWKEKVAYSQIRGQMSFNLGDGKGTVKARKRGREDSHE